MADEVTKTLAKGYQPPVMPNGTKLVVDSLFIHLTTHIEAADGTVVRPPYAVALDVKSDSEYVDQALALARVQDPERHPL